jgi:hypothetical protein
MSRALAEKAIEFLVGEVVKEANRDGAPLSEVERKMLFFSETGWTLPDMAEVANTFHREYQDAEYERKIVGLIRAARKRADETKAATWSQAVERLAEGDHYLLVMIDRAGVSRSRGVFLRAAAAVVTSMGAVWAFHFAGGWYFGHSPTRDEMGFMLWLGAIAFACIYLLLRFAFGSVIDDYIGRVLDFFTGTRTN